MRAEMTVRGERDDGIIAKAEWVPLALVWVSSVAYVVVTVLHHRPFDVQPTLALATALLLPGMFREPWQRHGHRRTRAR